eukprot:10766886-Alexandrium_andersonii.AAC.1
MGDAAVVGRLETCFRLAFMESQLEACKRQPKGLGLLVDLECPEEDPEHVTLEDIRRHHEILKCCLTWFNVGGL